VQTKELKIKCSVINLSAEVRIYRELAHATGTPTDPPVFFIKNYQLYFASQVVAR
jgi:hypothetical protein